MQAAMRGRQRGDGQDGLNGLKGPLRDENCQSGKKGRSAVASKKKLFSFQFSFSVIVSCFWATARYGH